MYRIGNMETGNKKTDTEIFFTMNIEPLDLRNQWKLAECCMFIMLSITLIM